MVWISSGLCRRNGISFEWRDDKSASCTVNWCLYVVLMKVPELFILCNGSVNEGTGTVHTV